MTGMLNALTFDLEEYFQVEAFKAVVGFADWDGFPSRVTLQTHRLLDLLESRNVTGTFFVVGWVAERQSALLRHIHERGHEVACHGQAHEMISAMSSPTRAPARIPRVFRPLISPRGANHMPLRTGVSASSTGCFD